MLPRSRYSGRCLDQQQLLLQELSTKEQKIHYNSRRVEWQEVVVSVLRRYPHGVIIAR